VDGGGKLDGRPATGHDAQPLKEDDPLGIILGAEPTKSSPSSKGCDYVARLRLASTSGRSPADVRGGRDGIVDAT
jgi:hypothetical protein